MTRKGVDTRYNCFGLCFASGLGWVGSRKADEGKIKLYMLGEQEVEWDTEFDARKVLKGNGWTKLLGEDRAAIDLGYQAPVNVFPGDLVVYAVDAVKPPEHVALLVTASQTIWHWEVLSKFGNVGEFIHSVMGCDFPQFGSYLELWGDRSAND